MSIVGIVVAGALATGAIYQLIKHFEPSILLHPTRCHAYQRFPREQHQYIELAGGGLLVCGLPQPDAARQCNPYLAHRHDEFWPSSPTGATSATAVKSERPIALICHGNAGTIESVDFLRQPLLDRGLEPWFLEYRTFGVNKGKRAIRNVNELVDDITSAIVALHPRKIHVLMGHSMGGGVVAQWLAQELKRFPESYWVPEQVVIANSFQSIPQVASDHLPSPLASLVPPLMSTKWKSEPGLKAYCAYHESKLQKKDAVRDFPRLLLLNAKDDQLISRKHTQTMYESLCTRYKHLIQWKELADGGHNLGWVVRLTEWMPLIYEHKMASQRNGGIPPSQPLLQSGIPYVDNALQWVMSDHKSYPQPQEHPRDAIEMPFLLSEGQGKEEGKGESGNNAADVTPATAPLTVVAAPKATAGVTAATTVPSTIAAGTAAITGV